MSWELMRTGSWTVPENGTSIVFQGFQERRRTCYVYLPIASDFDQRARQIRDLLERIAPEGSINAIDDADAECWHLRFSLGPIMVGKITPPDAPYGHHVLDPLAHCQVLLPDITPRDNGYFEQCIWLRRHLDSVFPTGAK